MSINNCAGINDTTSDKSNADQTETRNVSHTRLEIPTIAVEETFSDIELISANLAQAGCNVRSLQKLADSTLDNFMAIKPQLPAQHERPQERVARAIQTHAALKFLKGNALAQLREEEIESKQIETELTAEQLDEYIFHKPKVVPNQIVQAKADLERLKKKYAQQSKFPLPPPKKDPKPGAFYEGTHCVSEELLRTFSDRALTETDIKGATMNKKKNIFWFEAK